MDESRESVEAYEEKESMLDNQWPARAENTGGHLAEELDTDDEETPFPNVTGTSDPDEATSEAEPFVPAVDPPVLPGGKEGIHVATGFGISADEEAARDVAPLADDDIRQQAILALEQDALTSQLHLHVYVDDGIVRLSGTVDSVDEAEHAASLLGNLPGVVDVLDDTTVAPVGA